MRSEEGFAAGACNIDIARKSIYQVMNAADF